MVSAAKRDHIEKTVAYHMGELRRGFESGDLNEGLIRNMDEIHFVISCDNGRTLGFRVDTEFKYADVVSGGIGMTMMVCTKLCSVVKGILLLRFSLPINCLSFVSFHTNQSVGCSATPWLTRQKGHTVSSAATRPFLAHVQIFLHHSSSAAAPP